MNWIKFQLTTVVQVMVIAFVLVGSVRAEIIDTTPPLTSTGVVGTSAGAFQSFGQTFEVGSDTFLDSFTLYTDFHSGTTASKFKAYVMKWDSAANILGKATGPVLFSSDDLIDSDPGSFPPDSLTARTFSPDITLESGSAYVIFLSSSASVGEIGFDNGGTELGFTAANPYTDGRTVFLANGSDFGAVTTDTWSSLIGITAVNDLSFKVVLVPEPTSMLLFGIGTFFVAVAMRRSRFRAHIR